MIAIPRAVSAGVASASSRYTRPLSLKSSVFTHQRSDQPLAGGVDQRRAHGALDDASAGTDGHAIEVRAELAVAITDDELGALAERSGVAELLRHPDSTGGARDAHVCDSLGVHIHDEEREDWTEPDIMELQEAHAHTVWFWTKVRQDWPSLGGRGARR